jgi:hypothetical protein
MKSDRAYQKWDGMEAASSSRDRLILHVHGAPELVERDAQAGVGKTEAQCVEDGMSECCCLV